MVKNRRESRDGAAAGAAAKFGLLTTETGGSFVSIVAAHSGVFCRRSVCVCCAFCNGCQFDFVRLDLLERLKAGETRACVPITPSIVTVHPFGLSKCVYVCVSCACFATDAN
jgi:hypothetical protein